MKIVSYLAIAVLYLFITLNAQENNIRKNNIKISFTDTSKKNLTISYSELSDSKLRLTVTDPQGFSVENLKPKDINMTRDGYPVKVLSVIPLVESQNAKYNIVLCLDNSSSMDQHAKALLKIVDTLLASFTKGVSITTVFFDNSSRTKKFSYGGEPLKVDLREFGNNFEAVKKYCSSLYDNELTMKTYIHDQLYTAFNEINKKNIKAEDIFLIALSDGVDNASETGLKDVTAAYKKGKVYLIGFSNAEQNSFLLSLAENIKATYFLAQNADELAANFRQIGKRIVFSGYEVTYKEIFPPEITSSGFYQLRSSQYLPVNRLNIEEVKTREFFPLLNYIFFEKNSAELNKKYTGALDNLKKAKENFDEKSIVPQQMEVYNNLLNIVGSRMQRIQEAKLTLTGCNDNEGLEKNNKVLSRSRAEAVRDFIINNYNIDPKRIDIKVLNLPQKNSNTKTPAGSEENRRVEIYSDNEFILEPVEIISDTKLSDPEILNVNLNVKGSSPITNWMLSVTQAGKNIFSVEEKGLPPIYYSWKIVPSLYDKKIDSADFRISLYAKDQEGRQSTVTLGNIPVSYLSSEKKKTEMLGDKIIEKLSLVLFDFNSSKLDKRNQSILNRVGESITPFSILKMNGYTDSLGTEEANLKLSKERASAALKELVKLLKPKTKLLESEGFGEMVELYDNRLPEGRFYNRTCQLIIETPINIEETSLKAENNSKKQ